jgi:hypothetical protein
MTTLRRRMPLSVPQHSVMRKLHDANGKAVELTPGEQRTARALIKRGWATGLKSGKAKLARSHVQDRTFAARTCQDLSPSERAEKTFLTGNEES